ncbi:hypothetical protein [Paenibacillus sp. YSY-4.3]
MSERVPCQNPGCSATILPTTALKTGGTCMPCHQKKLALEQEAIALVCGTCNSLSERVKMDSELFDIVGFENDVMEWSDYENEILRCSGSPIYSIIGIGYLSVLARRETLAYGDSLNEWIIDTIC